MSPGKLCLSCRPRDLIEIDFGILHALAEVVEDAIDVVVGQFALIESVSHPAAAYRRGGRTIV